MKTYIDFAQNNGIELQNTGPCQFCGASTTRGVHECVEIFSLGFQEVDFSLPENHYYRFLIVDAHTLQHPELHGRWNNHFHLTRLHLILYHQVKWSYQLSPQLSDHLNRYKAKHPDEYLTPPPLFHRGKTTSVDVKNADATMVKDEMINWAKSVYEAWQEHHSTVDKIALEFLG